ncbi:Crp/Fnr family transcriptional regulator [uncultured Sphingomonas sp.]|jgi:CRP-like cAMP-binding protein|uniref:Crp/Fnr family transcriptional regulator n=1 Tax=uncultured Sphingomonas sp. TaxID=158754 RepID=UPI0026308867|nr:Crp/Fnr family transcriptional regulator [uncultured Sphingomonas sp.]
MHTTVSHYLDRFIDKIETRDALTPTERAALTGLPQKLVQTAARARIVEEGERPTHCCTVVEGIVYRSKVAASGRRQIISFHVPGDMVDLHTVLFKVADHTIETVRNTTVVLIPHDAILRTAEDHPALARAFWYDTLLDASIQREALLNNGRRDTRARTAHLFCELAVRLKRVGLVNGASFELPLTQTDLADALGVTPIHTNRVMAKLRAEGLIAFGGRSITIFDWKALVAIGEFDTTYLHLEGPSDLHL